MSRTWSTTPPSTHPLAGSNKERQEVGDPGHCERCAEVGHVRAHRSLGCGDVGCTSAHAPGDPADQPPITLSPAQEAALLAFSRQPESKQEWVRPNTRRWLLRQELIMSVGNPFDPVFSTTSKGEQVLVDNGSWDK